MSESGGGEDDWSGDGANGSVGDEKGHAVNAIGVNRAGFEG